MWIPYLILISKFYDEPSQICVFFSNLFWDRILFYVLQEEHLICWLVFWNDEELRLIVHFRERQFLAFFSHFLSYVTGIIILFSFDNCNTTWCANTRCTGFDHCFGFGFIVNSAASFNSDIWTDCCSH